MASTSDRAEIPTVWRHRRSSAGARAPDRVEGVGPALEELDPLVPFGLLHHDSIYAILFRGLDGAHVSNAVLLDGMTKKRDNIPAAVLAGLRMLQRAVRAEQARE